MAYTNIDNKLGMPTIGRPVTATLFVSSNGDNSDGSTWGRAYNTLNSALDAASTDANEVTAILLANGTYDINTTGDPTWSANVEIRGTHRTWAIITNSHASGTSILKLTGESSLQDLVFVQTGTKDGVIMTNNAFRIRTCGFNSSACTGAVTGIHIDGGATTLHGGRIEDVRVIGNASYTTAFYINNVSYSDFKTLDAHSSLVGVDINHASTVNNFFTDSDFGGCAKAMILNTGVESMHFYNINFHENTVNVDDGSGEHHHWNNINAELDIEITPEDRAGIEIVAGDTIWGADTELIASASSLNPFKVIGYSLDPSHEETTLIRFSADSGATFFITDVFADKKGKASGAGAGTDFIFNAGTRISVSCLSPDTGRTVNVWLQIQEI